MTTSDLLSQFEEIGLKDFSPSVQMRLMMRLLGEQLSEIRLSGDRRITNDNDFRELLLTLATEMEKPRLKSKASATCSACSHVHEGDQECAVYMGPTVGKCDCKVEVRV